MNNEIQWFAYLGVQSNVFASHSIIELLNITPPDTENLAFAQAVLDNYLTSDVEAIQRLLNEAHQQATSGAQAPSLTDAPAPELAQTHAAQTAPVSGNYPFNDSLFPSLEGLENAKEEQVKETMRDFLKAARQIGASDVHISAKSHPHVRYLRKNYLLRSQPILSPELAEKLNLAILSSSHRSKFEDHWDLDYSLDFGNNERYRSNVMKHNNGIEGSYRVIAEKIKTLAELGFKDPATIEKLTTYHQGLILIAGPAGCGKTTTLATLVELINNDRQDHIITVEDPVEILIESKNCNVSQRELHSSTKSFSNALRAALREDPDIIIVGEMRDLETIEMSISASETGHLVIGTLHTNSASDTIDRLLDVFPSDQQAQVRSMLAESLRGIICQFLIPSADQSGLHLAPEILIGTLAVANMIKDGKTAQLKNVMETGKKKGMILKDDAVMELWEEGKISAESAISSLTNEARIRQIKAAAGML